ncbi:MIP/aquaporin family protein [Hymenobacter nivis]|uniref:Aquaporin n=1 Tax=Hymenobacter nivis TaxID=1850093 RepID=A0A502HEI7_9BACT|nr:aquaporin [Hymenobacter nivis]TPG72085.1 aquaporin [Hymenobacter nivis]
MTIPTLRQCLLAEVLGTAFLMIFGTGAVVVDEQFHNIGHSGVAAAFGLIVLIIIQGLGHVSGAHVNPAVTIGFWAAGRFPGRRVGPYVAAQLLGAGLGSAAVRLLAAPGSLLGATLPAHGAGEAFAVELGLTFWLMFIILRVTSSYYEQGLMVGLTISAVVGLEALVGGPLSGASMNPARSLAPALVSGNWTAAWVYVAAPVAGALLAVWADRLLEPKPAPAAPTSSPS